MSFDPKMYSNFANLQMIDELYTKYEKDPNSVDASWRHYFQSLDSPNVQINTTKVIKEAAPPVLPKAYTAHIKQETQYQPMQSLPLDVRVYDLINAYRTYGHLMARINPIATSPLEEPPQLKIEAHGLNKQELSHLFSTYGLLPHAKAPLLDIVNVLKEIYCNRIGVEYMGLQSPQLEEWLQNNIEPSRFRIDLTIEQKQLILQCLNRSELFESFIHTKYVGQKRFSLEGGETLIPMLATIIDTGARMNLDEVVIGMAHRGRLNVLSNILDKSYSDIFSEFEDNYIPESIEGSGDVKYHKGFYSQIKTVHGHHVHVTLTPNPSHLEAVDPVVEGQVRGKQFQRKGQDAINKIVPILVHGDAAIAGQGVVYETMQLYQLRGYTTGGTIHIVINNQIGFTTHPEDGRSTLYCTDIARTFRAPVFHVDAEDAEGCVYATMLALQLRQKFHCDVFIDLNCYRKYGHNETDEPAFTQPLSYQIIRKKKPIREIYRDDLIHQGVLERYMAEALETEFKKALQNALREAKNPSKDNMDKIAQPLKLDTTGKDTKVNDSDIFLPYPTSVPQNDLKELAKKVCAIPEGFQIHPKLKNLITDRLSMVEGDKDNIKPVDWGMAELLCYGSLLIQNVHVRLSGQDCCRGTFSHRHAVWMDQTNEQEYCSLKNLKDGQAPFEIYNSPLSEYAVLGFEYGYSLVQTNALVIWEAQFGDFANGGQIIVDQFISTGEQKWGQKSGLVLFLPHGYEGQGPEHSSARIERFLTLAGNHNMIIANPTTPAQLFHLLRRQVLRPMQRPLVVLTPKGLLRHPLCVSKLSDFEHGYFKEVLDDPQAPNQINKLVFCSGRIYYDLIAEREKANVKDMAILRIEQLYPLDSIEIKKMIDKYAGFKEFFWVQDEPSNMGAWSFLYPKLRELLPKKYEVNYIGRQRSASTAVGSHALHKKEHQAIIQALFGAPKPRVEGAGEYKA